ncbi:unnamed protein product [Closterium sp. NIES-54]
MWIFRVKRPPGSPPVFKARYVARGFSQRQGVDYFQTFSPTPKMTTLRVLLHVAAQRDYELHSLDFSTAFLQGSLHEEIWLRRPPGFTRSFPPGTQWSLRRPVYGLRQAPREWHDTLRTTLAALGCAPSTADPSLFLRTDTSLPPFYILVYVDDLVFATADTAGLAHVKFELQKRHTCTDLGELRSYLGLQITRDRAQRTITLTQSHMVQQVLQRFDFTYSSPQATPLSTHHSLSALPSDESVEPSCPYPELVGCLMVLRYLCSTSGLGLVLGGRRPVVLTGHADASWADDQATQRSSQGYTFRLGSGSVSWRSTRSSSVLGSSFEAEIYAGAMAARELRWLTYLLTDLGEPPRSPPVLYVDNKAMLALCQEHRLEHRTKHIALRYFLALELQQRGQLRLAYVASKANTADIFTKALPPVDHQRFCTMLSLWTLGPSAAATTATAATTAPTATIATATTATATAAPACYATMASLRVLAFDHEGETVPLPPLPPQLTVRLAHSGLRALYDTVVARYSLPATAALGRLLLPSLFPELSAFATVEDLVSHLRTSDVRYHASVPAEFLVTNQPPMFITLYFIVTRLPDSLRSIRDHFLSLDPTSLTVDLLKQHLLAAETSAVAVGAARGTPRPPFFEGCSPSPLAPSSPLLLLQTSLLLRTSGLLLLMRSAAAARERVAGVEEMAAVVVEVAAGVVVGVAVEVVAAVGLVAGVGAPVAAVDAAVGVAAVEAVGLVAVGLDLGMEASVVASGSSTASERDPVTPGAPRLHTQHRCFSYLDDAWRAEFGDEVERPRWTDLLRFGVAIFDLDFDVILSAMYALSSSAEGDCYRCVPPDPGIVAAALGASKSGTLPSTAPAQALHTFTLDSGASRCFFRDSTALTPLPAIVPVRLADPSGGPVVARSSTVLPCPAVLSGGFVRLTVRSSPALVLYKLGEYRCPPRCDGHYHHSWGLACVICTCIRTGRHLATFTRPPGSSMYTLATEPPQVAVSAQVSASGQVATSCSCCLLSHQTLLWHHRLGHPSLPRLHGMHSRLLVSGLPRCLPPLPPSPAAPCLLCVEGRQRATPHSSSFPPTTAPLQTLHMDVWSPARISGEGCERYFLLVVDDYTRTFLSCVCTLTEVASSPPTSSRTFVMGRAFSSRSRFRTFVVGRAFSPQQNGIVERRIGLVMEVARTSMIHAVASHFLWPFAVQYATHQLNLWPRVSLSETSPTLRWTGEVGNASVFRFYHPTSRPVLPSQDVTFDESVPFCHLFLYRSAPQPSPPLFLAPGPPPVDPLPPQGPARSGVSQVDPLPSISPVEVAVGSSVARGAASVGSASAGAEPGGVEYEGAGSGGAKPGGEEPGGAQPEGVEPGGAESEGAESRGAEPRGAASCGGPVGASPRLSPQQLHEWLVLRARLRTGATGAGDAGDAGAGVAGVTDGASGTGGTAAAEPGGARTRGTGAGGAGATGAGAVDPGAGCAGGTVRPRPYFVPLLQQVLGVPSSSSLTLPLLCPPPDQSQSPLLSASPLSAPSPYTEQSGGLTERREPASCPVSPVRTARCAPRSGAPSVPGMHAMALRPPFAPLRVPLPAPPKSSLPEVPDPESDRARAASPTVSRLVATAVTDPSFEFAAASALVAELLDFAAACRLDYATALVAESASASPPSVGAAEPPSNRAAEPPSSRAAKMPSRPAAEPPSSRATRQPSSPAAEPPSRPAIEPPLFLPTHPGPTFSDWADGLSLFDLTSGASPAPPATADSTVHSQWATRDAAARLAVRRHLPTTERAHFSQYKSAQTLYDAVVARYSSPATAALSRLMLPYLFPDLAAFPTVADLITHLRTSDTRYRAALPAEDHFLSVCPTTLTVDLLEARLLAAETSIVAVGASRGDPRTPVFEGCSPSPLLPSVASAATADLGGFESVGAASAPSGRRRTGKGKGGKGTGGASWGGGGGGGGSGGGGGGSGSGGEGGGVGGSNGGGGGRGGGGGSGGSGGSGGGGGGGGSEGGGGGGGGGGSGGAGHGSAQRSGSGGVPHQQQQRSPATLSRQQLRDWYAARQRGGGTGPCTYVLRTGDRASEQCGGPHSTQRCFGRLTDAWRHQFPDATEIPCWGELSRAGVAIFDLDYDAILAAMYAVSYSAEGDCYLCVPLDTGIEAAALGAGEAAALGASASAAPGAGESALSGTSSAQAFHTFTLDSGASRSFFRDRTTLTPLSRPVAVSLADLSWGPVLASFSTVLPCPAAPSGTLSGLYLPSFSTNLVSGADLQDKGVDQFTPAGQRVTHCTCARTGRHLATFTRRPGSSLYTLTTASPPVAESGEVAASSQVFAATSRSGPESAPCSCHLLSHQTLLWHHRLGHPSLPRLRGMASRVLVSGLPRSLPPLPPGPAPTCVPCVEGRQRAAPHSSEFPPTEAPLQTVHMDLRERFGSDFPVLRLHSDRGGEFSSARLGAFCRAQGIRQTFTLLASPRQNGIAERRIGMVMDVARTSMIHAAAPHFLWPFAVQYAAHQLKLQPRVSLPETSPTLRWTGKVGDASAFRVWGSRAFVRDLSADKLSPRAVHCVFLGFPPDAPGWQFYHPTSRRVLSSQDVTFDESGPAPSGVSQVDAVEPVEVAVDSGAARGAEPAGAGGAEPGGAESGGAEPGGAESGGAGSWGAEPAGAEPGGAGSTLGASHGTLSRRELLSPQELCEWFARRWCRAAGAGGTTVAAGSGGTRTGGTGAAGAGGAAEAAGVGPAGGTAGATGGTGAAGPAGTGATGAGAAGVVGAGGSAGAGPSEGAGVGAVGARGAAGAGAAAEGTGAVPAGFGGATRPRPYSVPLLEQVLGLPPSTGPAPPVACPQPFPSQSQLQPASPLLAPSPYTGPTGGLAERREPTSRPASPVRAARTSLCTPRPRPPAVPGTHPMALRPSTAPLRVPLLSPPDSSLPVLADPESDSLCAASPTVTRLLATVVTDPSFESTAASALVAELVDFAAHCRLDYATSLVAESASVCPPSVGGECALSTDVLEDRQEEFQSFAAALPHLVSTLLAPEGDPDAPDIPTPRSYTEAIEGPYSSQWQSAMDAEMASWKSIGTNVDEVPPPGANITFSPTPKMTTLRVLLHVAAQRDYELHSLDFSTAFLQGSLHEEIWLRRPPGFTGSFPPGTQWSLRRPVYDLREAPREWHDTLRTTLAALGFAPSTADPSLFLRTDTSLPPFYIFVYVDDLVFATADTAGLAHVKSELQKRHTCTDLGELRSYLGLQITQNRAQRTITLTQHTQRMAICTLPLESPLAPPPQSPLPTASPWYALPLLVSGLPGSLTSLPRSPAPPCLPCVVGWPLTAPHSSEFPPTTAPLQTLHMDTTVSPLRHKADVSGVLIPWIRATHRQQRERFSRDFPVLRLHSNKDSEFSFDLLAEFYRDEGIVQTFTLPASPQQNGIAYRCIGLVMEVARTSMIHAAAPHFLLSFALRYTAHQLNLWPRVSGPEASPTLRWTGKVGDASVFQVWGALSLVHDAKACKLSSRILRCVEPPPLVEPLEISSDSSGPAEGGDLAADDTAATRHSPRLETRPGFSPWLSSPPPQPATVDSGAENAGAELGGAETEGEGSGGAAIGGAAIGGAAIGGAATGGAVTGGAVSGGPASPSGGGAIGDPPGGPGAGQPPQPDLLEKLTPQAIRAWIVRRGSPGGGEYGPAGAGAASPRGTAGAGGTGGTAGGAGGAAGAGGTRGAAGAGGAGATSPRGATGAGGAGPTSPGGTAGAGGAGGAAGDGGVRAGGTGGAGAASHGGARLGGTGAAGASGAVRVGGATRAAGSGGTVGAAGARGAGSATGVTSTGGAGGTTGGRGPGTAGASGAAGAGGAGGAAGDAGAGGAGATVAGGAGAAGTAPRRPFDSVLAVPQLLPGSPLPAPAPQTEVTGSLTEHCDSETRASIPIRARRVSCPRPPAVQGTHGMALRPSSIPLHVVLPEPPASSLLHVPDPESNLARASSPTVTRLLATDPDLESTVAFSLVTELVDLAARSRLDYVASLVIEFESVCPPSVEGDLALGSDVLEDK